MQQTWQLVLENDEVQTELEELSSKVEELEDELCELRHEVSHAKQDIKELKTEKRAVETELLTVSNTLEVSRTENLCLQEAMHKLAASRTPSATAFPIATLKPLKDYSNSHRRRRKRQISKICNSSLEWLQGQGYLPVSVTAVSMATGDKECIDLPDSALTELFTHEETIDEDDVNTVNMMLYLKDWHNISHEVYHELAQVCKDMPRHYKLKQKISMLNSLCETLRWWNQNWKEAACSALHFYTFGGGTVLLDTGESHFGNIY